MIRWTKEGGAWLGNGQAGGFIIERSEDGKGWTLERCVGSRVVRQLFSTLEDAQAEARRIERACTL